MLKPIHDTHSIEAVTLVCEFTGEVDAEGLAFVRNENKRIKARLPYGRVMRRSMSPAYEGTTPPEVRGFMYYNRIAEKEVETFEIAHNRASFTTRSYSKFEGFISLALDVLELSCEAFKVSGAKLESLSLVYNDEFYTEDYEWEPSEGLTLGNPYMASICARKGEFWHSSIGYFDEETDADHFILHNIDVSHSLQSKEDEELDSPDQHVLSLKLNHLYEFHRAKIDRDFSKVIIDTVNILRNRHKVILLGILSANLGKQIGLIPSDDGVTS